MKVIIHTTGSITDATRLAIASERVHHRINQPPYRPDPLNFEVKEVLCIGPHDYGDSLKALWDKGEGFINVEHDVAPWPGALTSMWECKDIWCGLPLIVHGAVNHSNFGCQKFSAELMKRTPDIWASYPRNSIFDWRSLDSYFFQKMKEDFKLYCHFHNPPALHFNAAHL